MAQRRSAAPAAAQEVRTKQAEITEVQSCTLAKVSGRAWRGCPQSFQLEMAAAFECVPLCGSLPVYVCMCLCMREQESYPTFACLFVCPFAQNLVRAAISSVAFLRNLFPEKCFDDKKLTGLTIKTLLPNDPEALLLCKWLEHGVFDGTHGCRSCCPQTA